MAKALTESATVKCGHQGSVSLTASQSVLKVGGQKVMVETLAGAAVGGDCTQKPPPASKKPCTAIVAQGGGFSKVLTVAGAPVLLDDSSGTTDGTPTNSWSVTDAGQQVLDAA